MILITEDIFFVFVKLSWIPLELIRIIKLDSTAYIFKIQISLQDFFDLANHSFIKDTPRSHYVFYIYICINMFKTINNLQVPLRYLLGSLYIGFKLLWEPLRTLISSHAQNMDKEKFWEIFGEQLQLASEKSGMCIVMMIISIVIMISLFYNGFTINYTCNNIQFIFIVAFHSLTYTMNTI